MVAKLAVANKRLSHSWAAALTNCFLPARRPGYLISHLRM